jgi:hypothetical protein
MKLPDLINIANEAYNRTMPEKDLVLAYYKGETPAGPDTLADFIARELRDTFDEHAHDNGQIMEAANAVESAAAQLMAIRDALLSQVSDERHDYDPNCDCDNCMWWRQDRDAAFEKRGHEGS